MGLWYWELMSHPDHAVLPVGTLHSLEWFWVRRRIFIYSHHNTFVRPSVTPFSPCSHHRIIMKFSWIITNDTSDVHAKGQSQRSEVKFTGVKTQFSRFRTITPVSIHIWWWNDAESLMLLGRGALCFSRSSVKFQGHTAKKIVDFYPN